MTGGFFGRGDDLLSYCVDCFFFHPSSFLNQMARSFIYSHFLRLLTDNVTRNLTCATNRTHFLDVIIVREGEWSSGLVIIVCGCSSLVEILSEIQINILVSLL